MKQYPHARPMSLVIALASTCTLLTACGGGGSETEAAADIAPLAHEEAVATAGTAGAGSPTASTLAYVDVQPGAELSAAVQAPLEDSAAGASSAMAAAQGSTEATGTTAHALATSTPALSKLPLTQESLLNFNADFRLKHEALPDGVPSGYDWYSKPRTGSWNKPPSGFTAITGWGQAFWTQGTTSPGAYLLLKNQMTLVCHGSQRQWTLIQSSDTEGAEFRPDFAGNTAKKALAATYIEAPASVIGFNAASAYHFWPKAGRASIPSGEICGMLFLVQARAEPIRAGSYAKPHMLLGMGADYWLNKTAPWDNYKTNKDVAIGRLKLVGTAWSWYGLSTASDADLRRLAQAGYVSTAAGK